MTMAVFIYAYEYQNDSQRSFKLVTCLTKASESTEAIIALENNNHVKKFLFDTIDEIVNSYKEELETVN